MKKRRRRARSLRMWGAVAVGVLGIAVAFALGRFTAGKSETVTVARAPQAPSAPAKAQAPATVASTGKADREETASTAAKDPRRILASARGGALFRYLFEEADLGRLFSDPKNLAPIQARFEKPLPKDRFEHDPEGRDVELATRLGLLRAMESASASADVPAFLAFYGRLLQSHDSPWVIRRQALRGGLALGSRLTEKERNQLIATADSRTRRLASMNERELFEEVSHAKGE